MAEKAHRFNRWRRVRVRVKADGREGRILRWSDEDGKFLVALGLYQWLWFAPDELEVVGEG